MPHLRAAYEKYHGRGFDIVTVSMDDPKSMSPEDLRRWTREHGMIWRQVYDQKAFESPLARAFFVGGIPAPFLIGRDGSLQALDSECRGDELDKTVEKALSLGGS